MIDSIHLYRSLTDGKYRGTAKLYVGDLIVQVDLTESEAGVASSIDAAIGPAYERAREVVRNAYEKTR